MSDNDRRRRPPQQANRNADRPPQTLDPELPETTALATIVLPTHANISPLVERNLARIPGSSRNANAINEILAWCGKNVNLLTPAPMVGVIPDGFSMAFITIWCDPADTAKGGDCFITPGGKRMPAKHMLNQLAHAGGVNWDPRYGRLDDASHPHYISYKAVAELTDFDGSPKTDFGTKQMDLRDGAPWLVKLEKDARKKGRDPTNQIIEERGWIQEKCETKAKNRAIRNLLGMKIAYTADELRTKPFVVAKLMFTGETDDPELRRAFAMMRAERAMGGTRALFGAAPSPVTQQLKQGAPPPPVGAVPIDDDDSWGGDGQPISSPNVIDEKPSRPRQRSNPPPSPQGSNGGGTAGGGDSGVFLPKKGGGGPPIESDEVSVDDLIYWAGVIEAEVEDGKSRNPDRDRNRSTAMRDEIAWREGKHPDR